MFPASLPERTHMLGCFWGKKRRLVELNAMWNVVAADWDAEVAHDAFIAACADSDQ